MTPQPARTLVCPGCGREVERFYNHNLCEECFLKSFALFTCPPVIKILICPVCGSYFTSGKWIESLDPKEAFFSEISRSIQVHPDASSVKLDFSEEEIDQARYLAHISVSAVVSGVTVSATADTEIRIKKETCDVCSRIAGGYYAGILQLRADRRRISEREVEECMQLADRVLNRFAAKGDRFAFVSKITELKEGVDLYVGSINACKHACSLIIREFGGTSVVSSSLVGKKDGVDLYRITCAARLPEFVRGDVVSVRGRVIEVAHQDRQIHGIDLADGSKVSFDSKTPVVKLGTRDDAVAVVLVAIEDDTVQVLDPETYRTVLLKKPNFISAEAGSDVCVIKTSMGLFLLPAGDG